MTGYDTDDLERDFADLINLSAALDQYSHGDYRRFKAGCSCRACRSAGTRFRVEARARVKAAKAAAA